MKGISYTYFTTDNAKSARELIGILREAKASVPPQLEEMASFGGGGARGSFIFKLHFVVLSFLGRYGGSSRGRGGPRYGGGGYDHGYGSRGGGGGGGGDRW
jgi:ATP-dependent RNA helicase DDX5/DBP2